MTVYTVCFGDELAIDTVYTDYNEALKVKEELEKHYLVYVRALTLK